MQSTVAFSSTRVVAVAARRERSAVVAAPSAIARRPRGHTFGSVSLRAISHGASATRAARRGGVSLLVRSSAADSAADAAAADDDAAPVAVVPIPASEGFAKLDGVLGAIKKLPPSERAEAAEASTKSVSSVLNGMKASGATSRWDCYPELVRRNIFPNELAQMGVKDPASIGRPSDTNDFNFIVAVVMSTSLLALVVGLVLPGDWGAFGSYLIGGISLAVLAVGSTAPGLLAVAIDRFARVSPAYRNRIARHEAAHFLVGYLLGCPVAGYSLVRGRRGGFFKTFLFNRSPLHFVFSFHFSSHFSAVHLISRPDSAPLVTPRDNLRLQ